MKIVKHISLLFALIACASSVSASDAVEQRALTPQDLREWRKITTNAVSRDGKWVIAVSEPTHADGNRDGSVADLTSDPHLQLFDAAGNCVAEYMPVNKVLLTDRSSFMVLSTRVPDSCRNLRSKKALEKLPMDTLRIVTLGKKGVTNVEVIDSLRNFKVAKATDWLAYQRLKKDSTLHVRLLSDTAEMRFTKVKEYGFSKKGASLYWLTDTALWVMDCNSREPMLVKEGKGKYSKITFDEQGRQLAFFYSQAKKNALAGTGVALWYAQVPEAGAALEAKLLTDSVNAAFPEGWVVSPNSTPNFSKQGSRLYFGTAPAPRSKDTIQAVTARPNVQVWSWDESQEYLVQDTNKARDSKRTYMAVCQLSDGKFLQIANKQYPMSQIPSEGDGDWAMLRNTEPYSLSSMWEAATRSDYASVNLLSGEVREVRKADYTSYRLSPSGRYAIGYAETDSLWRTIDMATGESFDLTSPRTFIAWEEETDTPIYPSAASRAYWLEGEEQVILGDGYDLYKAPVKGGKLERITTNGREAHIKYTLLELDDETRGKSVAPATAHYLQGFNTVTKSTGFYSVRNLIKPSAPVAMLVGECRYASLKKAQEAPVFTFTKQSFTQMPDIWRSDMKFRAPKQLTRMVDQQKPFIWGDVELVSWTSYKGISLQGLLYKPSNFDPTKKYPLIVNFYERNSDELYAARVLNPGRSTPDYHMYLSEGYVIFNPDVRYTTGHPGESCYDCVMSGIDSICALGFIDEKRIGASGHSWGGYQVAYLATRTNRFAAIESGAPVVNMFSAYGGIRWATGRARAFQYEHTQSRLGCTMWENPAIYAENSPLLQLDKVTTPILIMANDTDGHVPYTQGIEMFVAMKRLGKPSWLLNYTGEPHWPCITSNRVDFQIRLLQFFNHYLKDEPMPRWMSEGIKAVDQPFELGY